MIGPIRGGEPRSNSAIRRWIACLMCLGKGLKTKTRNGTAPHALGCRKCTCRKTNTKNEVQQHARILKILQQGTTNPRKTTNLTSLLGPHVVQPPPRQNPSKRRWHHWHPSADPGTVLGLKPSWPAMELINSTAVDQKKFKSFLLLLAWHLFLIASCYY